MQEWENLSALLLRRGSAKKAAGVNFAASAKKYLRHPKQASATSKSKMLYEKLWKTRIFVFGITNALLKKFLSRLGEYQGG